MRGGCRLYSATHDHAVHFNQFERDTADRIRCQRVNERTGKEVDYTDVVKGHDVGNGDWLPLDSPVGAELSISAQ